MSEERLERILTALTPERLRGIILSIARTQAPDNRSGVTLTPIIEALTGGEELGTGAEGWRAFLKLKKAIADTAAQIPGMRYVEGDA